MDDEMTLKPCDITHLRGMVGLIRPVGCEVSETIWAAANELEYLRVAVRTAYRDLEDNNEHSARLILATAVRRLKPEE